MKPSPGRLHFGLMVRVAISVGLLAWLLTDVLGIRSQLGALDPITLIPALLVFVLSCQLGALQWIILLRHLRVAVSHPSLIRVYWVGLFFNNFLPGSVGGDVAKVAQVRRATGQVAPAAAATIIDRLVGLIALVALSTLAAAALGDSRPAGLAWPVLTAGFLAVLGLSAVLLSRRLSRWLLCLLAAFRLRSVVRKVISLTRQLHTYRLAPGFLAGMLFLAVLVQALRVSTHLAVAGAMGIQLSPDRILGIFVLVPALALVIMIPISFNGLGVREFAATQLMPAIGIRAGEALALQIAAYLVQVVVSLIGAVLLLKGSLRRRWTPFEAPFARWSAKAVGPAVVPEATGPNG